VENMTDEMLVDFCKKNHPLAMETLFERYKPLLSKITRSYFLLGADQDDLMQEAMIGLYKAVVSFNANQQTSFKTFASLCVKRHVLDAIKKSNAQKHKALNDSVMFSQCFSGLDDENEEFLFEPYEQSQQSIEQTENFEQMIKTIQSKLSKLEFQILTQYLKGQTYAQIAQKLSINSKSVDNALTRIKKKLQFLLD
jgi:RNA polymerase sporulation-specific sigma factor